MSKLCETEEDAIKTVLIYKEKYGNGDSPYDSPAYIDVRKIINIGSYTMKVLEKS